MVEQILWTVKIVKNLCMLKTISASIRKPVIKAISKITKDNNKMEE